MEASPEIYTRGLPGLTNRGEAQGAADGNTPFCRGLNLHGGLPRVWNREAAVSGSPSPLREARSDPLLAGFLVGESSFP
jgi:hypothetical protein